MEENKENRCQRSSKRKRDEMEDRNQAVIAGQASTATITGKRVNTNLNVLSPFLTQTNHRNTDALTIKFNRLKDTLRMKIFYLTALTTKFVPKALELTLKPTNYDQIFIDNWYSKLKDSSLNLMEDVVSFCSKTSKETNTKIDQIEYILKQQLEKNEYNEIEKAIKSNEASTKKPYINEKSKSLTT